MLASSYIKTIEEKLATLSNQTDAAKKAADMISQATFNGKNVYVADKYNIVVSELVGRASGLVLFKTLSYGRAKLESDDVIIIASVEANDNDAMKILTSAREAGAKVVSISPPGALAENADTALINNLDPDNGILVESGIERAFCPISGIINCTLAWMITAETAALILAKGDAPSVFWGEHLAEGSERTAEAKKRFTLLGY